MMAERQVILGLFGLGAWEIILVLIAAVVVFGGRLPEVARNIGRGLAEFKRGLHEQEPRNADRPDDDKGSGD